MSLTNTKIARRALDKRLISLSSVARPSKGWIKAIREALGMPTAALAKRMELSQPRITQIEESEAKGGITLETLERVARALDCELVYYFRPVEPLEQIVERQAMSAAKAKLRTTTHTMALEAQSLERADADELVRQKAQELIEKSGSKLWGGR